MCIAALKARSAVPFQEHSPKGLAVGNQTAAVEPYDRISELFG